MEILIDGVKYVPEKENNEIVVHGITYDNVGHWLMNVESTLVNDWVNSLKENEIPQDNPIAVKKREKVFLFRNFCTEFLGYEWDEENYTFKEIK